MNKSEETIEIEKVAGGDALLWVVAVSESVSERKMGRQRKRWQVWAHPRGGLVEGSEEGTNESSGLRDNLWEGKRSQSLLCSIDSPSALLVSPHSVPFRDKTPPEPREAAHFNKQHASAWRFWASHYCWRYFHSWFIKTFQHFMYKFEPMAFWS